MEDAHEIKCDAGVTTGDTSEDTAEFRFLMYIKFFQSNDSAKKSKWKSDKLF